MVPKLVLIRLLILFATFALPGPLDFPSLPWNHNLVRKLQRGGSLCLNLPGSFQRYFY